MKIYCTGQVFLSMPDTIEITATIHEDVKHVLCE